MNNDHTKIKGKGGIKNRKELDEIMLSFQQGVPIGHPENWKMKEKKMLPTDCSRFDVCSANLCPLDPGLSLAVWFSDESICVSHQHSKHRWIKKQRSIQRRKTASWLDKPITHQMLYDASRKKQMSPDALEQLAEMRIRRNQIKCISVL